MDQDLVLARFFCLLALSVRGQHGFGVLVSTRTTVGRPRAAFKHSDNCQVYRTKIVVQHIVTMLTFVVPAKNLVLVPPVLERALVGTSALPLAIKHQRQAIACVKHNVKRRDVASFS